MGDFAGLSPFGVGGAHIRPLTVTSVTVVAPVAASSKGEGLSARTDSHGAGSHGAGSRGTGTQGAGAKAMGSQGMGSQGMGSRAYQTPEALVIPMPSPPVDENTIPGPPPAFQVSVLELDAQLLDALARMTAAESISRDTRAVSARDSDSGQGPAGKPEGEPRPANGDETSTRDAPEVVARAGQHARGEDARGAEEQPAEARAEPEPEPEHGAEPPPTDTE